MLNVLFISLFAILTIWFLVWAWLEFLKNGLSVLFFLLLGIMFFGWLGALRYWIVDVNTRGRFAEPIEIYTALLFLQVHFFVLLGYFFSRHKKAPDRLEYRVVHEASWFRSRGFYIGLGVLAVCFAVFPVSGGPFWTLAQGVLFGICFGCIYFLLEKKERGFAAFLCFILILSAVWLGYSSRRFYVALAIPLCFLLAYGLASELRPFLVLKLKRRVVYAAPPVAIIMFFLLAFMRADHDFGEGYIEGARVQNTIMQITRLRNADTFWNSAFVLDNFPQRFSYYWGKTYSSVLVAPIPRALWPEKPVGFSAPLAYMVRTGSQDFTVDGWLAIKQFSLSSGMVGELYANFGLIGCIIGPFVIGLFARRVALGLALTPFRMKGYLILLLPILFLMFRGDAYSSVNFSIFLILGYFIFERFLRRLIV